MSNCTVCESKLGMYEFNHSPYGVICDICNSLHSKNPNQTREEISVASNEFKANELSKKEAEEQLVDQLAKELEERVRGGESIAKAVKNIKDSIPVDETFVDQGSTEDTDLDIMISELERRAPQEDELDFADKIFTDELARIDMGTVILGVGAVVIALGSITAGQYWGILVAIFMIFAIIMVVSSRKKVEERQESSNSKAEIIIYEGPFRRVESGYGKLYRRKYYIGNIFLKEYHSDMLFDCYSEVWKKVQDMEIHTVKIIQVTEASSGEVHKELISVNDITV